jgi:hypothetical protein
VKRITHGTTPIGFHELSSEPHSGRQRRTRMTISVLTETIQVSGGCVVFFDRAETAADSIEKASAHGRN